jgi:hypothetical protein
MNGSTSPANLHPFLLATREAAASWHCTADGRLSPQPEPGILEARVAPAQLDRALAIVQAVIAACEHAGMDITAVARGRGHRAGIGVGRDGRFTAVRIEEGRDLETLTDRDIEQWLEDHPRWFDREWALRERHARPRANGRLRLLLPRRHDRSPDPRAGWRSSFADQVGSPLEEKLTDVVVALVQRAAPPARGAGET